MVGGKMQPTLYYIPVSPACRSILLLGKMLDLDFELKVVNLLEDEQMKPEFVAINPQHCLPTLKDQELVLWESRAILSFLVAAYGKDDALYPADIRVRALVDQRMQFDLGTLYHRMTDYYFPTLFMGAPLDETKKSKLLEALGWLDAILKGKDYAAANHFTIADLTLCVTVSQMEAFEFEMNTCKNVKAWLERCKQHLEPFDYEEINASKANMLGDMFRAKINQK